LHLGILEVTIDHIQNMFTVRSLSILSLAISSIGALWLISDKEIPLSDTWADLDTSQNHGEYMGYGIGIHASDISYPQTFDDLQPEFARMEFGPRWDNLAEKIPHGKTVEIKTYRRSSPLSYCTFEIS